VVLPYHRSSASGPLHIAMSAGLPVVATAVSGLVEAVEDSPAPCLLFRHGIRSLNELPYYNCSHAVAKGIQTRTPGREPSMAAER
jgi:hypothetical protein